MGMLDKKHEFIFSPEIKFMRPQTSVSFQWRGLFAVIDFPSSRRGESNCESFHNFLNGNSTHKHNETGEENDRTFIKSILQKEGLEEEISCNKSWKLEM